MLRNVSVCIFALVAVLLFSSDASACCRSRAWGCGGCGGYGSYGYGSGYGDAGYGRYGYGRAGYNPGGIGGPASGLGVRPGVGVGGLGRGR